MRILLLVLLTALWTAVSVPAGAQTFEPGTRIVLAPTNPLGVPLHRESRSSMYGRGESGLIGTVVGSANDGGWYDVQFADGRRAWVINDYLKACAGVDCDEPAVSATSLARAAVPLDGPFAGREQCRAAVARGERAPRAAGTLRVTSWNIRWFPVGDPGRAGEETDLAWLGCALAWINPDIVALQEILGGDAADFAWATVIDTLQEAAGGDWRVRLQSCGADQNQHVGLLWNADRVTLESLQDRWEMNGAAASPTSPCQGNLRPGLAAYVRSLPSGADFHLVSVHLDSGREPRDFDHRRTAINRLGVLHQALSQTRDDSDMLVIGDFNVMGNGALSGPDEIAQLEQIAAAVSPAFGMASFQGPACSEYYRDDCELLDLALATRSMEEIAGASVRSLGLCGALAGAAFADSDPPAAYTALSDHCPIVIDLDDRDLD